MAAFTTRVELHSAQWSDYENLHTYMAQQGFSRTIKASDGNEYHLPTAEYDISGNLTTQQVHDKAKSAADATGKSNSILVTEVASRMFSGLQVVKRQQAYRY